MRVLVIDVVRLLEVEVAGFISGVEIVGEENDMEIAIVVLVNYRS